MFFEEEIKEHKNTNWKLNGHYERDVAGIGCDLMFQKMWKQFPDDDIFILHADMTPHHEGWFEEVLSHVEKYPEAGMFGCLLLYPARNNEGEYYVQCAGGGDFQKKSQITLEAVSFLKKRDKVQRRVGTR